MLASLLMSALIPVLLPVQEPTNAEKFAEDFSKAVKLHENSDMDRALRRYKDEAVVMFMNKAEVRALNPIGELNLWVDSFTASWERVFHSDFARKYDRYLQMMDSTRRTAREKLRNGFLPSVNRAQGEALASRKGSDWQLVRQDAVQLALAFAEVSDLYHEAFAYHLLGNAWHPDHTDDDDGDAQKALDAYEKFIAARERLELTHDTYYDSVKKAAVDLRARLGIADPSTGEVGEKKISRFEIQPIPEMDWIDIELRSGFEEKPSKLSHFCDLADSNKLNWMITGLAAIDSQAELRGFEPKVFIKRIGRNEFVVEGGADASESFKISPKPTRVEFERLVDGQKIPHAMMFAGGTEREPIYGRELNLSIHETGATVFYRSIALRTAKTPFGQLTLWDHTGDGQFGYSKLAVVGAVGMPRGDFMYRLDGISLGKAKASVPYCRWFQDAKGVWYELKNPDLLLGDKLSIRPVAPLTGKVSVLIKGIKDAKLEQLLLVSQTRQTKHLVVNVANSKGVDVPIGRYQILQGIMRGKKGQELLILPSTMPRTIDVQEGEVIEISLGGEFKLAVKPAETQDQNGKLILDGQTLHVVGTNGERYVRFVGEPLFDAEVQVKGKKKAGTTFAKPSGQQMNDDFAYTYYPLDAVIPLLDNLEYKILIKKHSWFKKLDSGWISHN